MWFCVLFPQFPDVVLNFVWTLCIGYIYIFIETRNANSKQRMSIESECIKG